MARQTEVTKIKKELPSAFVEMTSGIIDDIVARIKPTLTQPINIIKDEKIIATISEKYHNKLPTVIRLLQNGLNPYLIGQAGAGKTHLVEQASKALNLDFYCISVCYQTTASSLLGYNDAQGKYVQSLFRKAYEHGGVFLLDEIDNGNANVLSVLNSALSNDVCAFPDGMIKKHKNFILCASGNTWGNGADRQYVGRNQIDAATLDRFVFVEIDYDRDLELSMCGFNETVYNIITKVRKTLQDKKIRHIVSPRTTKSLYTLLKSYENISDEELDLVLKATVFKSLDEDAIKSLRHEIYFDELKEI